MLTCSRCGQKGIPDSANKCPKCGKKLLDEIMLANHGQVCTKCGSYMLPRQSSPCVPLVAILLLLLGIIPGLLYIGICMAMGKRVCSVCWSPQIVPPDSPVARKIITFSEAGGMLYPSEHSENPK